MTKAGISSVAENLDRFYQFDGRSQRCVKGPIVDHSNVQNPGWHVGVGFKRYLAGITVRLLSGQLGLVPPH